MLGWTISEQLPQEQQDDVQHIHLESDERFSRSGGWFYLDLTKVQVEMYLACVCIIYMFDKGAVLLLNVAVGWNSPHHDCRAESCRNVMQFILSCN